MIDYSPIINLLQDRFGSAAERAGGVGYRYYHSVNVAHITRQLAQELRLEPHEQELAITAAYLHDVGKHQHHTELTRHEDIAAEEVFSILKDQLPPEDISVVAETIRHHDEPTTILQQVLHDADDLAEMGVMNIWKMFTYSVTSGRDLAGTIAYWRETDKARHLAKRETLSSEPAKRIATEYINTADQIIEALAVEISSSNP